MKIIVLDLVIKSEMEILKELVEIKKNKKSIKTKILLIFYCFSLK
jgi:hypothetical protein